MPCDDTTLRARGLRVVGTPFLRFASDPVPSSPSYSHLLHGCLSQHEFRSRPSRNGQSPEISDTPSLIYDIQCLRLSKFHTTTARTGSQDVGRLPGQGISALNFLEYCHNLPP